MSECVQLSAHPFGVLSASHSLRAREWPSRSPSRPMHPGWLRCSSVTYQRYAPSSRLASRAPRARSSTDLAIRGPLALAQRSFVELGDRAARAKVAVAGPMRADAEIGDAGPSLAFDAVGECREVDLLEARELVTARFVRNAFYLHGLVVVPADHERDARIMA